MPFAIAYKSFDLEAMLESGLLDAQVVPYILSDAEWLKVSFIFLIWVKNVDVLIFDGYVLSLSLANKNTVRIAL